MSKDDDIMGFSLYTIKATLLAQGGRTKEESTHNFPHVNLLSKWSDNRNDMFPHYWHFVILLCPHARNFKVFLFLVH